MVYVGGRELTWQADIIHELRVAWAGRGLWQPWNSQMGSTDGYLLPCSS